MSEESYEILRAAVNLARQHQFTCSDTLKARLEQLYPGKKASITEALNYWGSTIHADSLKYA